LGVKTIDPDDNFFAIGGHSLLAVKLMSAIQHKMGVELEMSAIYDFPTLREFSAHVSPLIVAENRSGGRGP
jgi:acyl carrier protein